MILSFSQNFGPKIIFIGILTEIGYFKWFEVLAQILAKKSFLTQNWPKLAILNDF